MCKSRNTRHGREKFESVLFDVESDASMSDGSTLSWAEAVRVRVYDGSTAHHGGGQRGYSDEWRAVGGEEVQH